MVVYTYWFLEITITISIFESIVAYISSASTIGPLIVMGSTIASIEMGVSLASVTIISCARSPSCKQRAAEPFH